MYFGFPRNSELQMLMWDSYVCLSDQTLKPILLLLVKGPDRGMMGL